MENSFSKFVLAAWLALGLGVSFFLFLLTPVSAGPHYRFFEIGSGQGFRAIAQSLADEKLIRSKTAFAAYGALSGSAHRLKPGSYLISAGSSTPAILDTLVSGPIIDREITLVEGLTVKDIDAIISNEKIIQPGAIYKFLIKDAALGYEFLKDAKTLEGFLFPDTYKFFLQGDKKEVIKKLLDNFNKKAWPLIKDRKDFREKLIIASLLEKEVPDFNDRRLIAGIIYKRLKVGMPLQVDATVVYVKCQWAFITCESTNLVKKDFELKSPYNTYLYNGLPPGPIGNPGSEAIRAAIYPLSSDYLYYLSDPKTQKTIFSKTLEEHNENRAKYLGI